MFQQVLWTNLLNAILHLNDYLEVVFSRAHVQFVRRRHQVRKDLLSLIQRLFPRRSRSDVQRLGLDRRNIQLCRLLFDGHSVAGKLIQRLVLDVPVAH